MYKINKFLFKRDYLGDIDITFSNQYKMDLSTSNYTHEESGIIIFLKQIEDEIFKYTQSIYGNPFDIETTKLALLLYFMSNMKKGYKFSRKQIMNDLNFNKKQVAHVYNVLLKSKILTFNTQNSKKKLGELVHLTERGYQFSKTLTFALDDILKRTLDHFAKIFFDMFYSKRTLEKPITIVKKLASIFFLSLKEAMDDPGIKEAFSIDLHLLYLQDFSTFKKTRFSKLDESKNFSELVKDHEKMLRENNIPLEKESSFTESGLDRLCIFLLEDFRTMENLDKINYSKPNTIITAEKRQLKLRAMYPKIAAVPTRFDRIKKMTQDLKEQGINMNYKKMLQNDPNQNDTLNFDKAFSDWDTMYMGIHQDVKGKKSFLTWTKKGKARSDEDRRTEKGLRLTEIYFRTLEEEKNQRKKKLKDLSRIFKEETTRTGVKGRRTVFDLKKYRGKKTVLKEEEDQIIEEYNIIKFKITEDFIEKLEELMETEEEIEFVEKLRQKVEALKEKEEKEREEESKNNLKKIKENKAKK